MASGLRYGLAAVPGRWWFLICGILLQISFDFTNAFLLLSPSIVKKNHFDNYQANGLQVIADSFSNFSIFVAVWFSIVLEARYYAKNSFIARFGTHLSIVVAAVLITVCYFLIWMNLEDKIKEKVYLHFLYTFALSHASSLVNTANIIVAYLNFPNQKGAIVCLLQSYYLLNGYVFQQLNKYFFDGHTGAFLWVIVATPVVIGLLWVFFLTFRLGVPEEAEVDQLFTISFFVCACIAACIIFILSVIDNTFDFSKSHIWVPIFSDVVIFLAIVIPVIYQVWVTAVKDDPAAVAAAAAAARDASDAAVDDAAAVAAGENEGVIGSFRALLAQFATIRFWAFAFACVFPMASKEYLMEKLHEFGKDGNLSDREVKNLMSLSATCAFMMCLAVGWSSDVVQRRFGLGRPWFLVLSGMTMVVGQALCMKGIFAVGAPFVAAAYGGFSALLPTVAGEVYNIKYVSTVLSPIEIVTAGFAFGLGFVPWMKHHEYGCLTYLILCLVGVVGSVVFGWLTQVAIYNPLHV
ncbi:putative MFS transporter superfamily [Helianthus annuus]|nr:putative MFS transporter superfamily [Helianthus annuus]